MRIVCVTRWGLGPRRGVEYWRRRFRPPSGVCLLVDRGKLYYVYPSVLFDLRVRVSLRSVS